MRRPPMVAVIGRKHSGKTTLLVRLAAELHRRGRRVMTIKHGSHTFNIDPSTTDTYRAYHEGHSERVAMVAPDKFALIVRWSAEETPETIAERHMSDADIVLCEGFKQSALPKIEIFRRAAHQTPLFDAHSAQAARYLAIVTDADDLDVSCALVPLAEPRWLEQLADLVEGTIMRDPGEPT